MTTCVINGCNYNSSKLSAGCVKSFCLPSTSVRYFKEFNDQELKSQTYCLAERAKQSFHMTLLNRSVLTLFIEINNFHFIYHSSKNYNVLPITTNEIVCIVH